MVKIRSASIANAQRFIKVSGIIYLITMIHSHKNKNRHGFTLIELLVVVAIISLLSSVIFASLNSARAKAKDTRKIADLKSLQTALELYYNDNGKYPGVIGSHRRSSVCLNNSPLNTSYLVWTDFFNASFTNNYMKILPSDPTGNCYTYINFDKAPRTVWRCYIGATIINPNLYSYLMTFNAESSLSYQTYPGLNGAASTRRCMLGPLI